jgi:cobalamin biosynthesis protein CbiG
VACGEAVIVAGLGFRRGCLADDIVRLVHTAQDRAGRRAGSLAAPDWKRGEPGLHAAAGMLGLPIAFVGRAALAAVQPLCPTRSTVAERETGVASVAEGAALAASGGRLLLPRIGQGSVTCALAGP